MAMFRRWLSLFAIAFTVAFTACSDRESRKVAATTNPVAMTSAPRALEAEPPPQRRARRQARRSAAGPALGDGGPGNSGGFGFPARHLDLSSYRRVASGLVDAQGERQSLFTPSEGGAPLLVAALLARKEEEAGRPRPGLRGMPLGLPSLTLEQIQLVDTWIAQGRPQ